MAVITGGLGGAAILLTLERRKRDRGGRGPALGLCVCVFYPVCGCANVCSLFCVRARVCLCVCESVFQSVFACFCVCAPVYVQAHACMLVCVCVCLHHYVCILCVCVCEPLSPLNAEQTAHHGSQTHLTS